MANPSREYQQAVERAYAALGAADADPSSIAEPHRSIALVDSCLGLIENGGIEYLFECQLPHQPPYGVIAAAFRNCGAPQAAALLEAAADMLPGDRPHLDPEARAAFLRAQTTEFKQLAIRANALFWAADHINNGLVAYAARSTV